MLTLKRLRSGGRYAYFSSRLRKIVRSLGGGNDTKLQSVFKEAKLFGDKISVTVNARARKTTIKGIFLGNIIGWSELVILKGVL